MQTEEYEKMKIDRQEGKLKLSKELCKWFLWV